MGKSELMWLETHSDRAATLKGLGDILKSMRWEDIEMFAHLLNESRSAGLAESRRRLSAGDVLAVARNVTSNPSPTTDTPRE